jgi:hypothetical protein
MRLQSMALHAGKIRQDLITQSSDADGFSLHRKDAWLIYSVWLVYDMASCGVDMIQYSLAYTLIYKGE